MRPLYFKLLMVLLACSLASGSQGAWTGQCVGVSDGDTIRVMRGGRQIKIRLFGIDCPELGQDFGRRAKEFTSAMVFGKQVHIEEVDYDDYGRVVAWVSVNGQNLNKELVRAGLAWWYRRYAPHEAELKFLKEEARISKRGLWSAPHPAPPWQFRHNRDHGGANGGRSLVIQATAWLFGTEAPRYRQAY